MGTFSDDVGHKTGEFPAGMGFDNSVFWWFAPVTSYGFATTIVQGGLKNFGIVFGELNSQLTGVMQ